MAATVFIAHPSGGVETIKIPNGVNLHHGSSAADLIFVRAANNEVVAVIARQSVIGVVLDSP
jgi:hypothetical protein